MFVKETDKIDFPVDFLGDELATCPGRNPPLAQRQLQQVEDGWFSGYEEEIKSVRREIFEPTAGKLRICSTEFLHKLIEILKWRTSKVVRRTWLRYYQHGENW